MTAETGFGPIPDLPELGRVVTPAITIDDSSVIATVQDVDSGAVTFRFAPVQAVRVTTIDCFREPAGLPHRLSHAHGARSSPWLDDLTAALADVDRRATFMDDAVHVIVPVGDNVLEVVAWKVEATRPGVAPVVWPPSG